jgi:hypothetical protein
MATMNALPLSVALLASLAVAQSGWSPPTFVTPLNSAAADSGANLSADGLTAHWASFSTGNWEIWSAQRATRTSPWGAPVLESALSDSAAVDAEPALGTDGLTIYLASMRAGGAGSFDILRATRATPSSPWSPPVFVAEVNSAFADSSPSITEDGLELYFLTTGWSAPNPPQNSIHVAKRASTGSPFGMPALVAELSSPNTHRDVDISTDGLSIAYTEYDPGSARLRVHRAVRTSRSAPFDAPVALAEFDAVGTSVGVYNFSRTRDGLEALLSVGFPSGAGGQELMASSFEGLTVVGVPATASAAELHYRDSASPGALYAIALAAGNTGFQLGSRRVPIDLDALFAFTFGVNVPGFTAGFAGNLDGQGQTIAAVLNPRPIFAGIELWACAFTVDFTAPFAIKTISNDVPLELH